MNYSLNSKTTLGFKWSEKENDWMIYFPRSGSGSYLHSQLLERRFFLSLLQELLNRDYDLSTFLFRVHTKEFSESHPRKRTSHFRKENVLAVYWNYQTKEWMIRYPNKSDGSLIAFDLIGKDCFKEILNELTNRKYDVKTLCIYVERREMNTITKNNIGTWVKRRLATAYK
ncbi:MULTISPECIES: hypothetical protein [Bacillus cereus group]|uniref:hypothetical protein n=1 Tax=Bacillus cereus group TaxID=86661 RepID=UPI000BF42287|nr:hypothetical protein [Bacillus cereus]PES55481.1 hypothetical protein CN515_05405 [Bacillus cereus]